MSARVRCLLRFSLAKNVTLVGSVLCFAAPFGCGSSESKHGALPGVQPTGGASGSAGGSTTAAGAGGTTAGGAGRSASAGAAGGLTLPPGISDVPKTIECDGDCSSATLGVATASFYLDPCCGGENHDQCGVDTTFLSPAGAGSSCEPRNQPGSLDTACPSSSAAAMPGMSTGLTFDPLPGCCRPDGSCGIMLNAVTAGGGLIPLAQLGLGCVDAAPFFPGEEPVTCGPSGSGGAGGGAGQGGAGDGGAGNETSGGAGSSGDAGSAGTGNEPSGGAGSGETGGEGGGGGVP
jgi:hypothetical protein